VVPLEQCFPSKRDRTLNPDLFLRPS
jgi:hypothetical protein